MPKGPRWPGCAEFAGDADTSFVSGAARFLLSDKRPPRPYQRPERLIDQLLDLVRRDREWNEQAARKQLVKFFEAIGLADPLTVASRRRLSSILFS